jgi:hypothetical protein
MSQHRHALFSGLALPIEMAFDDETLYSLCSRYHYVSGAPVASATALRLFGNPRHGAQHDFPSGLDVFVERTEGAFGRTVREVLFAHTIIPFYLPWVSPERATQILQLMTAGRTQNIKALLGLPASRTRAHHPLKACPMCMQEDQDRVGVAYWRLIHQLPAVWMCPTHRCHLLESCRKANGVHRFQWLLPSDGEFYRPTERCDAPLVDLSRLATASINTFRLPPGTSINQSKLLAAYRSALQSRNLLRGNSQLALHEATEQFFEFSKPFRRDGLYLPLPETCEQCQGMLSRILRLPTYSMQPMRHLLVIIWLYSSWPEFWNIYSSIETDIQVDSRKTIVTPRHEPDVRARELARLIRTNGMAPTTAARLLGISPQTAQMWMSRQGMKLTRRPKLSHCILDMIRQRLLKGDEQRNIASGLGVSVATVTRMLHTEPGLLDQWTSARHQARRSNARAAWQSIQIQHPEATAKQLRTAAPAAYSWLYRNDRAWLAASIANAPRFHAEPRPRVDWSARDEKLSAMVEQVLAQLRSTPCRPQITRQLIYQAVPMLKPYLGKLGRLPRTRKLLENARGHSTSETPYRPTC